MRPEEENPHSRIVAAVPFMIGAIAVFALAAGAATLSLPKALAMVTVCFLAAASYTAICYRIPDINGQDPHDRNWILRNMTHNLAAAVGIAVLVLTLNSHGIQISPILLIVLNAMTFAWAIWTTKRASR